MDMTRSEINVAKAKLQDLEAEYFALLKIINLCELDSSDLEEARSKKALLVSEIRYIKYNLQGYT